MALDNGHNERVSRAMEQQDVQRARRRRSASLSALAAGVTATFFVWAIVVDPSSLTRWLVTIGLPPVALSVAAAVQYRRTSHTGAGAAAAALYWAFVFAIYVRGGLVFVPGALLQTTAWFVSRPRSSRSQDPPAHT